MKVLVDLNVLLDVIQRREPHYAASATVLDRIASGEIDGAIPGHALTTVYYLVARFADEAKALQAVDWILDLFEVVPEDREVFLLARSFSLPDFEDAVVAAAAAQAGCDRIVTRNVADFGDAGPPAVTPAEWEAELLSVSAVAGELELQRGVELSHFQALRSPSIAEAPADRRRDRDLVLGR